MEATTRKGVMASLVVAAAMMVAAGVAHRRLAAYVGRPTDSVPLANEDLARLPMTLGPWVGEDLPLAEAVIQATDTDAHISRIYRNGPKAVSVFVAYGVNARQLRPHTPRTCYPLNGWTLDRDDVIALETADGSALPCTVYRFERGGLDRSAVYVLNYYIVDGQYCPNDSLLRAKAWRGSDGIRYMLQVQVSCPGRSLMHDPEQDPGEQAVRDFAFHCAPQLRTLIDALTRPSAKATTQPSPGPATRPSPGGHDGVAGPADDGPDRETGNG